MNDEVVLGLFHCLVDALEERDHAPDRPLKVSQLYQELVPYSAVRAPLDLELNADYEHALLRLLSGERGLLRLEPRQARAELRREAERPFPAVGLFRKFAASDVWVGRPGDPALPTLDEEDGSSHDPDAAVSAARDTIQLHFPEPPPLPRRQGGAEPARQLVPEPDPEPVREPAREEGGEGGEAARELVGALSACAFCGHALPGGRRVRFCPFCGADQRLRPCPRCDAVLEQAWRYCISCGRDASVP
jgi:hypothetical protein